MAVVHDAELMTVGPDEAVVTFRTDGDEPVTTRFGVHLIQLIERRESTLSPREPIRPLDQKKQP